MPCVPRWSPIGVLARPALLILGDQMRTGVSDWSDSS